MVEREGGGMGKVREPGLKLGAPESVTALHERSFKIITILSPFLLAVRPAAEIKSEILVVFLLVKTKIRHSTSHAKPS